MAGPWFTVQQDGNDWHTLDRVWLSNGKKDLGAKVQIRLRLAPATKPTSKLAALTRPEAQVEGGEVKR